MLVLVEAMELNQEGALVNFLPMMVMKEPMTLQFEALELGNERIENAREGCA